MGSKKVVVSLDLHDDRDKQKAMKAVSKIPCIDSITMDMKAMKLTVIGDIDPINVVSKLRKYWSAEIFSVGPWPEKKDDPAKKTGEGKKEGGGGGGGDNKKKEGTEPVYINPYMFPFYQYPQHIVTYNHPHMNYPQQATTHYPPIAPPYYVQPQHEENPNGCVIC